MDHINGSRPSLYSFLVGKLAPPRSLPKARGSLPGPRGHLHSGRAHSRLARNPEAPVWFWEGADGAEA
jgi:hypothetical protein